LNTDLILPDGTFDLATFDSGWTCDPDGDGPEVAPFPAPNEPTCSFRTVLGNAAARLITKAVGIGTSVANTASPGNTCGYSEPAVVAAGDELGTLGQHGSFTLTVADCPVTLGADPVTLSTSCDIAPGVAIETLASGAMTVDGTKVIGGLLTGQAIPNNIVPIFRDDVSFSHLLAFNAFQVFDRVVGTAEDTRVTVTGDVTATVTPALAQSDGSTTAIGGTPAFTIQVPIAAITASGSADVTIFSDGNTFNVSVTGMTLDAFNGSWSGVDSILDPDPAAQENSIEGTLTVDGIPVTLVAGSPLDPEFNNDAVTASYSCNPDLTEPVPAAPAPAP
jgi:hypothetical protein